MRNAFASEITELAGRDERIVLLMADIGNRLFNTFRDRFPQRFFNCGVAEANMISMAAGLASEGLRPVCYTITPFVTARCYEQIRIDVCYHRMPVTIVGTGSGLSYASLGATHHSCDDIALMRVLPEMVVMAPADAMEVRGCLRAAQAQQKSPVYIRIGKKGETVVHAEVPEIVPGRPLRLREGGVGCLLACGHVLPLALQCSEDLVAVLGGPPAVYSVPVVKPLPKDFLEEVFSCHEWVGTIEEHGEIGGFGSAVAEWFADRSPRPRAELVRFATADRFLHETHNQASARRAFGLEREAVVGRLRERFGAR